jgi:hypothetical protein
MQLTKIGPAHSVPHRKIWIEGKRLTAAGFHVGTRYRREETAEGLTLTRDDSGPLKVSGKVEKPIIDTSGSIVPRGFPSTEENPVTHVSVTFGAGIITMMVPPAE